MFKVVLLRPQGILVDKWIQTGEIRDGSSVQLSVCRGEEEWIVNKKRRQLKESLEGGKHTGEDGRAVVIRIVRAETLAGVFAKYFDSASL